MDEGEDSRERREGNMMVGNKTESQRRVGYFEEMVNL